MVSVTVSRETGSAEKKGEKIRTSLFLFCFLHQFYEKPSGIAENDLTALFIGVILPVGKNPDLRGAFKNEDSSFLPKDICRGCRSDIPA